MVFFMVSFIFVDTNSCQNNCFVPSCDTRSGLIVKQAQCPFLVIQRFGFSTGDDGCTSANRRKLSTGRVVSSGNKQQFLCPHCGEPCTYNHSSTCIE